MSKTWRTMAMLMNKLASAKYLPGQTLRVRAVSNHARRAQHGIEARCYSPSAVAEDVVARVAHARVQLAVAQEPLRGEAVRLGIYFRVVHACPAERDGGRVRHSTTVHGAWGQAIDTYHVCGERMVPFGMKYPRYSMSSAV